MKRVLTALLILCASSLLAGTHRHVDASVSSGGSGTVGSPWSLTYALAGAGGTIGNGDTVYCNPGTYLNPTDGQENGGPHDGFVAFTVAVNTGTSGHPVIFRSYPGQVVVWDGRSTIGADIVRFTTPHVWLWGIRITSSNTLRNVTSNTYGDWSFPDPVEMPVGPATNFTSGATGDIKLINCIIDNCQDGYGNTQWQSCTDAEAYGCLLFNNGWTAPDRHHGHNVYIQNTTGSTRKLTQCISWGASENNVQAYGSNDGGQLVVRDMNFTDLICFQTGSDGSNFLLGGGGVPANNNTVDNGSFYQSTGQAVINLGWVPYGGGISNLTWTNNYVGGRYVEFQSPFSTSSTSGNLTWYTDIAGSLPSGFGGTGTKPTTNVIKIYLNAYESGRADVVIFNWEQASNVTVDLSSFLSNGNTYNIVDAQNPFVTYKTGTYGGPVTFDMTVSSTVQPIGNDHQVRTHTPREFGCFIVTGGAGAAVVTPSAPIASSATGIMTTGFTAHWGGSTGATGYRLDVATDVGFSSLVVNDLDCGNAISHSVTGLSQATTYYYRVRAYNGSGTSGNSNTIGATTASVPPPTSFLLLQRTYFGTGRPSDAQFLSYGISPAAAVYQDEFGCPPPNQSTIQAAATTHLGDGKYVFLNDECLDVSQYDYLIVGAPTATANINDMVQTYRWYKTMTSQTVGLYSYVPETIDYHWVSPSGYDAGTYAALNNFLQPIADAEDYIAPSIYNTITDSATMQWKVETMTREAVRVAKGKPVYPFISPQYYYSDMTTVPYGYWKMVLNTLKSSGASGAIIFVWQAIAWDENAGWWTATKEFLGSPPPGDVPNPPANISSSNVTTTSFAVSWTSMGGVTYHLDVATDAAFSSMVGGYNNLTVTSPTTVSGLSSATMYYFRLRGSNGYGTGSNSATYNQMTSPTIGPSTFPSGSLSADPKSGTGTVTVTWTAKDATSATLNGSQVSTSGGSMTFSVSTKTIFTLILANALGSVTYLDSAAQTKFRQALFLPHSVGECFWDRSQYSNLTPPTTITKEVTAYNASHPGANVSMSQSYFPAQDASGSANNNWSVWNTLFAGGSFNGSTLSYSSPVVIVKTCYLQQQAMTSAGDIATLQGYIRNIVRVMASHPNNFFVLWNNYPAATDGASSRAVWSAQFSVWMKDVLAKGLDSYGAFPKNVYVFDVFRKLANGTTGVCPSQYGSGSEGPGGDHPSNVAVAIVDPQFVSETFNAAIAYETGVPPPVDTVKPPPVDTVIVPPPVVGIFKVGDTVQVSASVGTRLSVRSAPVVGDNVIGTEAIGAKGVVLAGSFPTSTYTFWQIKYSDMTGYSADKYLVKAVVVVPPPPITNPCDTSYNRGFAAGRASVICPPAIHDTLRITVHDTVKTTVDSVAVFFNDAWQYFKAR